jgi:hypothetical protein
MTYEVHDNHRERERHCRSMAQSAKNPEIRRRHEELANLHARQAASLKQTQIQLSAN